MSYIEKYEIKELRLVSFSFFIEGKKPSEDREGMLLYIIREYETLTPQKSKKS